MNIRKMARNPGWWRLFLVLTGFWYGGWFISAFSVAAEHGTSRVFRADDVLWWVFVMLFPPMVLLVMRLLPGKPGTRQ